MSRDERDELPAADRPPAPDPDLNLTDRLALDAAFLGPTVYWTREEFRRLFPDPDAVASVERALAASAARTAEEARSARAWFRLYGEWPVGGPQ